jgi:antitoxin component YwqK of YwqJK toxin-antitoxin module
MIEVKNKYYDNGNIWIERYYLNGELHRENGPALIHYDENGNKYRQAYYISGNPHREDYIRYYENGNIIDKSYYLNGKRHREDGPAFIRYHENGNVLYEHYYLNGKVLTKEKWYSKLTTEQKVNLLYGKGNE